MPPSSRASPQAVVKIRVTALTWRGAAERAAQRNLPDFPLPYISRSMATSDRIETLLDEQRSFAPPPAFRAAAHVRDETPYEHARRDREGYWAGWAQQLEWIRPWDRVLEWKPPHAKWFLGGKLNASANCLDRPVKAGRG